MPMPKQLNRQQLAAIKQLTQDIKPRSNRLQSLQRFIDPRWQDQLAIEQQRDRPQEATTHPFKLSLETELCDTCDRPHDAPVHRVEPQPTDPALTLEEPEDLDLDTLDDVLTQLPRLERVQVKGRPDRWVERPDPRASTSYPAVRIPPETRTVLDQVAPGIFARHRVLVDPEDRGELEHELDFISPHRGSTRPQCARCERCQYGTIRSGRCTQCSHEQGVRRQLTSELSTAKLRSLSFEAWA